MLLRAIRRAVPCLLLLAVVGAPGREARAQGQYTYDPSGNIVTVGTDSYLYDRFGRVQSGTAGTGHAQAYTYDRYGNIQTITTTANGIDAVRRLGVNASSNRLSETPTGGGSAVYGEYDDAGRMTQLFGVGSFLYDGTDSVSQSIVDGQRRIHLYTADDERIASIDASTGDRHWTVRDGGARVLRRMTRRSEGTWLWDEDYVYRGPNQLAALVPNDARHFHLDHLGSSRLITGAGGATIEEHRYYAFGEEATVSASTDDAKKFTGHERDNPSLDYMHARYYGPKMGRFLSVDPVLDLKAALAAPQMWNRFAYVRNNPVNKIDLTGKYEEDVHQRLTYALSRAAGFSASQAGAIANADQGVDENPDTQPFHNEEARTLYHFTTPARRTEMWGAFEKTGSLAALGQFFHAQQDSYSHAGYEPARGHLFAGHGPDKTYKDTAKALKMAFDTYSRLNQAADKLGISRKDRVAWDKIKNAVIAFNSAKEDEKDAAMQGLIRVIAAAQR
ncbi:MAG: RHS repeat-associated core domain-containing protein [Acidobacteria bacterium]|nr:RHS repeat-associated core domain-containing protein [Acidobacteriota bacterium]